MVARRWYLWPLDESVLCIRVRFATLMSIVSVIYLDVSRVLIAITLSASGVPFFIRATVT